MPPWCVFTRSPRLILYDLNTQCFYTKSTFIARAAFLFAQKRKRSHIFSWWPLWFSFVSLFGRLNLSHFIINQIKHSFELVDSTFRYKHLISPILFFLSLPIKDNHTHYCRPIATIIIIASVLWFWVTVIYDSLRFIIIINSSTATIFVESLAV